MNCALQKKYVFTDEHRANMSAAQKKRYSNGFSDQHRANLSAAGKGRVFTDQHRANLSAAQKARTDIYDRGRTASILQTPEGRFASALDYAAFIGRARITVYKRMGKHPNLYYFINEEAAE